VEAGIIVDFVRLLTISTTASAVLAALVALAVQSLGIQRGKG
jgi:hypothetical protein